MVCANGQFEIGDHLPKWTMYEVQPERGPSNLRRRLDGTIPGVRWAQEILYLVERAALGLVKPRTYQEAKYAKAGPSMARLSAAGLMTSPAPP